MEQKAPEVLRFDENSWLLQWPPGMNVNTNMAVHNTARYLKSNCPYELYMNPAYDSLLVTCAQWDALDAVNDFLEKSLSATHAMTMVGTATGLQTEPVIIPVCYDLALGNDLEKVRVHCGLSTLEIIRLHTAIVYQVFMIGFLPGFAYMGETDERIDMPRKASPEFTRAGAVGIAGRQTGIYPLDSPGGWHILGYTHWRMLDVKSNKPVLLEPGAKVSFTAITIDNYYAAISP